ncbi:uncharacterized protein BT62DRAFT_763534 [Guyanagaster necrorhizus]|uniref:Uncharacterized protein n=1 Tax=Guyanagaster necrorhizus TaxID=856835 RepID=A0A9P8AUB2_9AGAR|nr:uncharacterized protein BT62DRAFT_763534 [Guyanagaster necrorhizus MCA 3950]KAG7448293.1 hypothetical protein BT62DRAFT_763534 [Guyanagaster necrorhizus MCA 3950]
MMSLSDMSFIEEQRSAPIDQLFVKILIYIFHLCILDCSSCFKRSGVNDYLRGPWKLGQICSPWGQIVNNTPTLWTQISLADRGVVKDPVSRFKVSSRGEEDGLSAHYCSVVAVGALNHHP